MSLSRDLLSAAHGQRQKAIPDWLRRAVHRRDGYACAICDSPDDLCCHHVRPEYAGGLTLTENLVTLCESCHREVHARLDPLLRGASGLRLAMNSPRCIEVINDLRERELMRRAMQRALSDRLARSLR